MLRAAIGRAGVGTTGQRSGRSEESERNTFESKASDHMCND